MKTKRSDAGHTVKDSVTGERLSEPEMIKQSYVEYFKTLLTPNEKKSQCERIYDLIEEVHRLRMTATQPEEQQICDETDCIKIYQHLPKKTSPSPDGIPYEAFMYAGKDLIESTQRMFNKIWQMEKIPDQWKSCLLYTSPSPRD